MQRVTGEGVQNPTNKSKTTRITQTSRHFRTTYLFSTEGVQVLALWGKQHDAC
jgi:hypothetical protein